MSDKKGLAVLGCGDYLRWQKDDIKKSERVEVKALFDPLKERAESFAAEIGGKAVDSAEAIFDDDSIDVVCLFVPPWIRRDLIFKAVEAGKHIITTKPLASNLAEATEIVKAVDGKVHCAVFYGRTGDSVVETMRRVFVEGGIGALGLYKQDWLHHYPTWNDWATDPDKNGGPFMDAMIHNLNAARYLAGEDPTACTFFSETHSQKHLKCADTESLKVDFPSGAAAYLFITWAADLEVFSNEGNDREHLDVRYVISDQGWFLTVEKGDDGRVVQARKDGEKKTFPVKGSGNTEYDIFVGTLEAGGVQPFDVKDAWKDSKILSEVMSKPNFRIELSLDV